GQREPDQSQPAAAAGEVEIETAAVLDAVGGAVVEGVQLVLVIADEEDLGLAVDLPVAGRDPYMERTELRQQLEGGDRHRRPLAVPGAPHLLVARLDDRRIEAE